MGAEQTKLLKKSQKVIPSLDIPVIMVHQNHIIGKFKSQLQTAVHYNPLISMVGEWTLDAQQGCDKKYFIFRLVFDNHFNLTEHPKWIECFISLLNCFIRHQSNGYLFGVAAYEVLQETNTLECALVLNELIYLDSISIPQKDNAVSSLRQLITHQCQQHTLFRVYYDPGLFDPSEIDGILKQVRILFQNSNSTFLFIHEKCLNF